MKVRSTFWLVALITGQVLTGTSLAEDAKPQTEEKCVERCDVESDKCMADSDGDADKMQACDDQYSDCLQACENPG
ncbi:MAG: hypothetical protein ACREVZ_10255 [Burkholderiales bacterium]